MNVYVVSADEDQRLPHHEPISPELALVDPELARRARAMLPNPGEHEARARIAARLEQPPASAARSLAARYAAGWRHRPRWLHPVAIGAAFITTVFLADVLIELGKAPPTAETPPVELAEPTAETSAPLGIPAPIPSAIAPTPARQPQPPSARPKPATPQPARPRRPARPTKPQRSATPTGTQARSFAWAPAPGATGYHVEFFRGDARIFVGNTPRPAITVPSSWQFAGRRRQLGPGEYRWYVWPVVRGNRRNQAIVQAELTVPSP